MIEITVPENKSAWLEMRAMNINSTESAALFGLSPYMSAFELWHTKKNQALGEIVETERMKWGSRLQDAIAKGIAEDNGWSIRKMEEYIRDVTLRMGSSFDFSIVAVAQNSNNAVDKIHSSLVKKTDGHDTDSISYKDTNPMAPHTGLLEIKNVDALQFKEGWIVDDEGNIEAPPHIEIQVQHQLAVSGREFAYIGALVGGNRVALIRRDRDDIVINAIRDKVESFWLSIKTGVEPDPDFERDADFIQRLYNHAEPGKVLDGSLVTELIPLTEEYYSVSENIKHFEEKKSAIKAQILMLIGDAEKVTGVQGGFSSITAGIVGPASVSYERAGYRNFRINWPKKRNN